MSMRTQITRHLTLAVVAVAMLSLTSTPATAGTMTLQQLFDGGVLEEADKRFFGWTLESDDSSDGLTGDPEQRNFANINVTTFSVGALVQGITYTDLASELFSTGGSFDLVSFTWTYRVETISGDPLIKDNELDMTGTFDVGATGDFAFVDIREDLFKANASTLIGNKEVFAFGDDLGNAVTLDDAVFTPEDEVFVRTTIELSSGDVDAASVSMFTQSFSQRETEPVVPEPASIIMFAMGAAISLPLLSRRRRQKDVVA